MAPEASLFIPCVARPFGTMCVYSDMFHTTAYGKAVVKYIQTVTSFECFCEIQILIWGHVETVPMSISPWFV